MAPLGHTSKRTVLGTLLAERLLDIAVILTLFLVVGYGLLGEAGAGELRWILLATAVVASSACSASCVIRRNERLHAFVAPILSSTLQLRGRHGLTLLGITFVIWALEAGVWMSTGAAAGFDDGPDRGLLHRRAGQRVRADPVRARATPARRTPPRSPGSSRSAAPTRRR